MATLFALLLVALMNSTPGTPVVEDSAETAQMLTLAEAALAEAGCEPVRTSFDRDASDGVRVLAMGECEFAAEFYLSPETGLWQFAVVGS
jgi:hypothetical protein